VPGDAVASGTVDIRGGAQSPSKRVLYGQTIFFTDSLTTPNITSLNTGLTGFVDDQILHTGFWKTVVRSVLCH
jgi:hypothetical protein